MESTLCVWKHGQSWGAKVESVAGIDNHVVSSFDIDLTKCLSEGLVISHEI